MVQVSPARVTEIRALLGDVPLQVVTHIELKRLAPEGRATVRTGDSVPYANIILVSG
jgi:D-ribose pyranase